MSRPAVTPTLPGYYGKLPARGDFVSRRLPRVFLDPWDAWLQEALASSREQLGDAWLEDYLVSPLWRFVLAAGACGPAVAGVLMPSVDRVGRYFPLTLAALAEDGHNFSAPPDDALAWFQGLEELALEALEDGLNLERFSQKIAAMGLPDWPQAPVPALETGLDEGAWHIPLDDPEQPEALRSAVAAQMSARSPACPCLWWTTGSERIAPCLLVSDGLPSPGRYAALLTGEWQRWGWTARSVHTGASAAGAPPAEESL